MGNDTAAITDDELAELMVEAGHHHHAAYIEADGVDPEWALWYASYLQTLIWDRLGRLLTKSELVYLLVASDLEVRDSDDPAKWPQIYSRRIREYAQPD